jgi:hypothetical protein
MNLLSWNYQGLGNLLAIQDLCRLVKEKRPTILFLMETKCRKDKMEALRVRLEFEGLFVVDAVGRSGGLALLWKESSVVEIQNYTCMHINAIVWPMHSSRPWRLTGFYGNSNWTKQHDSWTLVHHLKPYEPKAWLCIGDFNEIINQSKKWGGAIRSENQMMQFQLALEECGLSDLGYRGSKPGLTDVMMVTSSRSDSTGLLQMRHGADFILRGRCRFWWDASLTICHYVCSLERGT